MITLSTPGWFKLKYSDGNGLTIPKKESILLFEVVVRPFVGR
jgi:hypothetical protein